MTMVYIEQPDQLSPVFKKMLSQTITSFIFWVAISEHRTFLSVSTEKNPFSGHHKIKILLIYKIEIQRTLRPGNYLYGDE
jgi:hypothetical protein